MQGIVGLPQLTIIIPNHNYGKWLPEAIMSAATDSYPAKKIVVVDNGSTDDSWSKLATMLHFDDRDKTDNQIHAGQILGTPVYVVYVKDACGPSAARNKAINLTWNDTHIYGLLDADDVYLPGKIEKSVERFLQDPMRIGAIYTDYDTIDIDTGVRTRTYKEPFNRERLLQECIVHSACFISKLALQHAGLFDEDMRTAEDWDLWLRIAEKFVFVHIPEPLMLVRVGSHNSTSTVDRGVWEKNWQRIRDKLQRQRNG